VEQYPQLFQPREGDRRQAQQERKPRRFFTLEVEEQCGGQGRTRAGNPWNQRADLRNADNQRIPQAHFAHRALMPRAEFSRRQQHRHHQAGNPDHHQPAQRRVAGVEGRRQGYPGDPDRNRRQHNGHRQLEPLVVVVTLAHRSDAADRDLAYILPEVTDHCCQCGQLHGCGKRRAGIRPAEQGGHDAHVGGGRHGQQFGDALNDAQDAYLQVIQGRKADIEAAGADVCQSTYPESKGREVTRSLV